MQVFWAGPSSSSAVTVEATYCASQAGSYITYPSRDVTQPAIEGDSEDAVELHVSFYTHYKNINILITLFIKTPFFF